MNKIYGYIRVSTSKQNTDRQEYALDKYANDNNITIDKVFEDKLSGSNFDRPSYQELKSVVNSGDTVIIKEIDRLGRDWTQNKDEWKWFIDKEVNLIVVDTPILSAKAENIDQRFIQEQMFTLLNYLAEKEREKISIRTKEGLAEARRNGVKLGAPRQTDYSEIYELIDAGATYRETADQLDISLGSVQNAMRVRKKRNKV